jgi:hypothetical protein
LRTQEGCAGHAGLGADVRAVAVSVLDRIEPALDRIRAAGTGTHADTAAGEPATCGVCPVCAVIAAVRREHPELAARVAEQAAGMLAVLRTALDEGDPAAPAAADAAHDPAPTAPAPTRRVQRIPVDRPRAAR